MMIDSEKIEWFDKTMDWLEQFGTPDEMIEFINGCGDAAYDLFFDAVDQYKKVKGIETGPIELAEQDDVVQQILSMAGLQVRDDDNIVDRFNDALLNERDEPVDEW